MAPNVLLLIISFLLVLLPKLTTSQFNSMCVSQYALANQACSVIPPEEEEEEPINGGHSSQVMLQRHKHHHQNHDNHTQEHEHEHDDNDDEDESDNPDHPPYSHHPRANRDCCRWLQEVERTCVCETFRRLPAFLTRPVHSYTIAVGTTCEFTYKCDGL